MRNLDLHKSIVVRDELGDAREAVNRYLNIELSLADLVFSFVSNHAKTDKLDSVYLLFLIYL